MTAPEERITTIDLLRHGACEGGEIYRGTTDVALTPQGWEQMEASIGDHADWHCIVSSPLTRCKKFAEQHAERLQLPLQIKSDFREMDFGAWEGRLLQEVWAEDPDLVSRFYADPAAVTPPGGEPVPVAQERSVRAWQDLLCDRQGENILLVCHGGIIRLLLSHLLGMSLAAISQLHVPYGCLARIRVYHRSGEDFPVLVSLNAGIPAS